MTEQTCAVGPCQNPRAEGSQFCAKCGPRFDKAKVTPKPTAACPRCGSANLVPRRKTSTKVVFGFASLLGRAKHAECASCGYLVKRPN